MKNPLNLTDKETVMVTKNAREIVGLGEKLGLSNKKMAKICGVSPVTISRWKITNRANSSAIAALEKYIEHSSEKEESRKYLDEANLEDLAHRARQLGFRITLEDMSYEKKSENIIAPPKEESMDLYREFINNYDRSRIEHLCTVLKNGKRGVTLGKNLLKQLDQGHLDAETYKMLSRWVNPYRAEHFAQPIAAEISMLLFGEEIERIS
jgi:transposase